VGLRRNHPYPFCRMVGGLPERLVLGSEESVSETEEPGVSAGTGQARRPTASTGGVASDAH
jgi:hypothetical protein